eukprot:SAG31_NODE_4092_length_3600_cov_3.905109_3_plen_621_part_00
MCSRLDDEAGRRVGTGWLVGTKPGEPNAKILHLNGTLSGNKVIGCMSGEQLGQLRQVWQQVDADGNGVLDAAEIEVVMARMRMVDKTAADVLAAMGGDIGTVGFEEFVRWFKLQNTEAQTLLLTVYYRSKTGEQATATMAELPALMAAGAIDGDTIVWAEGMDAWTPVDAVLAEAGGAGGASGVARSIETALAAADDRTKEVLLSKVWARVDKDGNGSLDAVEIGEVLLQMTGRMPSAEETSQVMQIIDADGNGEIDFEEFRAWYKKQGQTAQQALITVHYRSKHGKHEQTTMAKLPSLVERGEVDGQTLVWVEGLSDWAPLQQAQAQAPVVLGDVLGTLSVAGQRTSDEIEALFRAIDTDGDGTLDLQEFTAACRLTVDDADLAATVFQRIDTDGGGTIDLLEFRAGFEMMQAELCARREEEASCKAAAVSELARQQAVFFEAEAKAKETALRVAAEHNEELLGNLADKEEELQMLERGLGLTQAATLELASAQEAKSLAEAELASAREEISMLEHGIALLTKKLGDSLSERATAASRDMPPLNTGDDDPVAVLFHAIDTNGDGMLDRSEFGLACLLAVDDSNNVDRLFDELDADGGGSIDIDEFRAGFQKLRESITTS